MFLEKLVTLGKAFLESGMNKAELLELITDVKERGALFLKNIAIIEISMNGYFQAGRLPIQIWGEYRDESLTDSKSSKRKVIFQADLRKGMALPFTYPQSGNPTVPQGKYGLPVYLIFSTMIQKEGKSKFLTDLEVAHNFLKGRLERTLYLPHELSVSEMETLAKLIQIIAFQIKQRIDKNNKGNSILMLCIPEEGGPYQYSLKREIPGEKRKIILGESVLFPGRYIVADLEMIFDRYLKAKIEEGAEFGKSKQCNLCGVMDKQAVSVYCKAWPWLAPTWHPPFSEGLKQKGKVKNLSTAVGSLCPECYSALMIGSGIFTEVSSRMPNWLTKELFLPTASAGGRNEAEKKDYGVSIQGSVLVLPHAGQSQFQLSKDDPDIFHQALRVYREKRSAPNREDKPLFTMTGLESTLPQEFDTDDYGLTMVYFTQDNADIHLRALFEDVLPSVVTKLQRIIKEGLQREVWIRDQLELSMPDWMNDRYGSLPFLLIRAYGGCYLWQTMEAIFNGRLIGWKPFISGVSARMNGYAKSMILGQRDEARNSFYKLKEEIYFYALFHYLFWKYLSVILKKEGYHLIDWKELLQKMAVPEVEIITFNDPEELGFVTGYVVKQFSRWYYGKLEKDFLMHRVMTFGSDLTPDEIWKKGLSRFPEYRLKLDLHISEEFLQRSAMIECEYRRLRDMISKHKDEFMGAFWSGYMLAPKSEKGKDKGTN